MRATTVSRLWPQLATVFASLLACSAENLPCPEACVCYFKNDRMHTDCSNLGLSNLPPGIDSDVQVLDLSNNLFDTYPDNLQELERVEVLSFVGNLLSTPLPQYFVDFQRLEVLNLSHNKYDEWDCFDLGGSIEKLDLSSNFINRLSPTSFRGMHSLKFLDLSENRISEIPDNVFNETNNLETLILSRNNFDEIPKIQTTSLETLDLSMCQISSINADSFDGKTSLLEIDLSKNLIDSIPELLYSNTLQVLDLSYNEISTINVNTFRALPHLAVLNLSGNEFEEIWTPTFFSENKYIREVYLNGIRWGCEGFSVNLLLMYDYFTRDSIVPDRDNLICYTPANVTGWNWQRAYMLTWHIEESNEQTITYLSVLAGLLVGVVITALLCRASMKRKLRQLESQRRPESSPQNLNLPNGDLNETRIPIEAVETVEIRIPLRRVEDLPPTYDEALLMPRLDGSFHSLPDYLGPERPQSPVNDRLSRSINNLLDPEMQATQERPARVSTRRVTTRIEE